MLIALLMCALWMGGCDKSGEDTVDSEGRVKYVDPLGFSIRHEPGYKVSFQKGAYIQILSDDEKSRGIVFPFIAKQTTSAELCLTRVPQIFTDIFPDAKLAKSRQIKQQPDEAIAEFTSSTGAALALCSMEGLSGVLYLAISPDGIKSKAMTSIIGSFKTLSFDEPAKLDAQTADDAVAKTWIDPVEKAFRIRVPDGWTVEGGLARAGTVDVRIHIRMKSADGALNIGFGDKNVPHYSAQRNAQEGTQYNPGFGNVLTVKRYISGGNYAAEYATTNAEILGCPGVMAQGKELDELTTQMQQASDQAGLLMRSRVSAGEATVECTKDGQEHYGYIFAKTTLTPDNMGQDTGTWTAEVMGFTAPKSKAEEARAIAVATFRSFQWEPAWSQAQGNVTMNTAHIVSQTGNQIANMMSRQYAKSQVTMDRVFRNWSNATLGQTDVVDATTGETYKIASGRNYYWRRTGTNVIAGTNQYERPDIDFTQLLEY